MRMIYLLMLLVMIQNACIGLMLITSLEGIRNRMNDDR